MSIKNELKSIFTEHWKYLAISAASKINLFDKIFNGQNTIERLVKANNWHQNTLKHLLSFLKSDAYIIELDNNILKLTEKGDLLREENLEGLYYACLNWSGEHLTAWQNLDYTKQTGKSSFEQIYQKTYFDYLNDHPEKLSNYHTAMFEYAIDDYQELPTIIDFSIYKSVMDVGGGYGAAINLIKTKNQNTKCFLFDLEKVVEQVTYESIERIGGDFFDNIPSCADAIILSRVLHDWNDEKANLILKNCFNALPDGGNLYVIENCKEEIQTDLSLLSLNMTVMCESFERTSIQYNSLCNEVGFKFHTNIKLNDLQTILIFKK